MIRNLSLLTLCLFLTLNPAVAQPPDSSNSSQLNQPAFELMRAFRRGVNFGNFLEVPPAEDWGDNSTTNDDFRIIAAEGFDHVRIPVGWHHYTGPAPDYTIKEAFFERVEQQLDLAMRHQLGVVINVHHFDEFLENPAEEREKLMKIWEQIASRFKDRPLTVAFEILNEPNGAADASVMNDVYLEVVSRIRKIDPQRLIMIGPDEWNSVRGLENLRVPDDDRIAVTIHCYEPFLFTHQGATWTPGMAEISGVTFPAPGKQTIELPADAPEWVAEQVHEYNRLVRRQETREPAFVSLLKEAARWGKEHHRPMYVGEFGAVLAADPESRARFYRQFRLTAERLGMGWCIWDWKAGFQYWNRDTQSPEPGLREALFSEAP